MFTHLRLVALFALLVTATLIARDDASDLKKLIGTWEFVSTTAKEGPPKDAKITVIFAKDGKLTMKLNDKGKTAEVQATYTLKDKKLTVKTEVDGKTKEETSSIKELTDKKLVTVDEKEGKKETTEFKKND
jgi:uncharacterized protein (TIGR03066 family)